MCWKLSLPCGEGMRRQNSEEVPAGRQRLGHCWGTEQRNDDNQASGRSLHGCTQGEDPVGVHGKESAWVGVGVQFRAFAFVPLEPSLRDSSLPRP